MICLLCSWETADESELPVSKLVTEVIRRCRVDVKLSDDFCWDLLAQKRLVLGAKQQPGGIVHIFMQRLCSDLDVGMSCVNVFLCLVRLGVNMVDLILL